MKLLIFIYSMGDGGAERVTAGLSNYWATKGWEISIVTMAPISQDLFELNPLIQRISLETAEDSGNKWVGFGRNLVRIRALRSVLKQVKPDIALGMMITANVILALASLKLSNIKTIGSERNTPVNPGVKPLWHFLRKYTYGLLDAVTTMSDEGKVWMQHNTCSKQVFTMVNSVSWPLPKFDPQITPQYSAQRLLIGVGRLVEAKGFDSLISAFGKLKDKYPTWNLVILGDGPCRNGLENQIQELDLINRAFLPGRVGNIGEWYEIADLFVLSSHYEGFPNVLAEAMAYGLPAVSFNCHSGPRDIIRHGVDGFLVEPGDLVGLVSAMECLMKDDDLRNEYSLRAKEVRERFSFATIVSKWELLFGNILDKK